VLGVEHTVIESVELETDERGQELLVALWGSRTRRTP
jgi:hypothetical protein